MIWLGKGLLISCIDSPKQGFLFFFFFFQFYDIEKQVNICLVTKILEFTV